MRYEGWITDIDSIKVGNWSDTQAKTGCTVLLFEQGAICGVDVRGAAPGTRETDLLRGYHLVDRVNALVLSGGSAFGLAAADGVMHFLEERKVGFLSGQYRIPIVPAAVLYDLAVGDGGVRPDAKAGYEACLSASSLMKEGRIGAGTGASIGKLYGPEYASPGGVGTASVWLNDSIVVSAIMAVNAVGDVHDPKTGQRIGGCQRLGRENLPEVNPEPGGNTTIGVVATNAMLTREECNRLAEMGQDGLVLAIRPVHTPFDGDTIFGASTNEVKLPTEKMAELFIAAAEVTARAVQNAIWASQEE